MSLSGLSDKSFGIRRGGAVDYVLEELLRLIESGVVVVGERLPSESALAAQYGVSRAVIREVLRTTEARGLTMTQTGRGTFVVGRHALGLSFAGFSVVDLLEARPSIEVPAAALAAVRRTDSQVDELQQLLECMEAAGDGEWTVLDAELHTSIAAASANPVFSTIMTTIRAALERQSQHLNRQPTRRRFGEAEHRRIVSAIARRASLEAEDAMTYHLDEVKETYLAALRSPSGSTPAPPL